jgi:ribA/ribD-fused uncharacterized protein
LQNRYGCPKCRQYFWERNWNKRTGGLWGCPGCYGPSDPSALLPVIWFYGTTTPYYEFSNFHTRTQFVEGHIFRSTEHWFQSMKSLKPEEQAHVRNASSPALAKKRGRSVHLQVGWGTGQEVGKMRDYIMFQGLWAKAVSSPAIGSLLLFTGDLEIRERSPSDRYWGGAHQGDVNRLGALWMAVRLSLAALRDQEPRYVPVDELRYLRSGVSCGNEGCYDTVTLPAPPPCPNCGRTSIIGNAYVEKRKEERCK